MSSHDVTLAERCRHEHARLRCALRLMGDAYARRSAAVAGGDAEAAVREGAAWQRWGREALEAKAAVAEAEQAYGTSLRTPATTEAEKLRAAAQRARREQRAQEAAERDASRSRRIGLAQDARILATLAGRAAEEAERRLARLEQEA